MQYKIEDFLNLLMRPKTKMELRAIKLPGRNVVAQSFVQSAHDAIQFGLKHGRDAEIYMGVAPRTAKREYASPTVAYSDVDFKLCGEKAARLDIEMMDMEPSVIVNSGGGLHLYWIIDGLMPIEDCKDVLKGLVWSVSGADMASAEIAHILRVPGTMNHKYTPPRLVTIEKMDLELKYEPWEFTELLDSGRRTAAKTHVGVGYSGATASDAAIVLAKQRMAEWPIAVEGDHGDDHTYKAACMLIRDLGLSEEDAFDSMASWNERCLPPWSDAELRKKIHSAVRYGKSPVGHDDPAAIWDGLEVHSSGVDQGVDGGLGSVDGGFKPPETELEMLDRMFKVVDDNGELRIYRRMKDEAMDRFVWRDYRRQDFLNVCESVLQLKPKLVEQGKTAKYIPRGEFWLSSSYKKKTFNGIVMRPEHDGERTPDNMLNLWQGFAVEEKQGNWDIVKELAREVLLKSDRESYEYVMNWMARSVQIPWEPAKTAIVFRGRKGAGKSRLGYLFWRLFGQHGYHITSREQLTGRFNAHLRDCVALFADEAFYAGDKLGESHLKGLITEHSLTFERKGKDPEMGRNYLHIMMASNMEWVVPASMQDERRFAVFEVSDENERNRKWFDPLYDNNYVKSVILPAMLYELRRRDIRDFDVFAVPQTEALVEQKAHSMDHIASWLLKCAENNWLDFGVAIEQSDGNWYSVEDVFSSYLRDAESRGLRVHANEVSIGTSIRKYLPGRAIRKKKIQIDHIRRYFYALPDAEDCVSNIEKFLGIKR